MSDRRDATERYWETPFEHLDREEHAEKAMLGWALRALRDLGAAVEDLSGRVNALYSNQQGLAEGLAAITATQHTISRHLAAIQHQQEYTVADLTALTAALAEVEASAETASAAVLAALAATSAQLADLKAQIDALTVGAVTQDQIDALTATAADADKIVDSITAAVTPAPAV